MLFSLQFVVIFLGKYFKKPVKDSENSHRQLKHNMLILWYSVMQSEGNSFCGDVVLDGFNVSYRDDDSILAQKYESKYLEIFIMKILYLKSYWRKCIFNDIQQMTTGAHKIGF